MTAMAASMHSTLERFGDQIQKTDGPILALPNGNFYILE